MLDILQLEPFTKLDRDLKKAAFTLTTQEARYLVDALQQRSIEQGNGCWVWTGARTSAGYGLITRHHIVKGRPIYTHRLAYSLLVGEIPDKLLVLHHCDNPACWRPDHLFLGTDQDNTDDKVRKGRLHHGHLYGEANYWSKTRSDHSGEKHPSARLTWEKVREIRARYAEGDITQDELGHIYGVARITISAIITGRIWQEETKNV